MTDMMYNSIVNIFGGNSLVAYTIYGTVLGLGIMIAGKAIKFLLNTIVRKVISKTDNNIDDKILDVILERIIALSGVVGLFVVIQQVKKGLGEENVSFFSFLEYCEGTLYVITAILLTSIVIKISRTVVTNIITSMAKKNNYEEFGQTLPLLTNRVVTFVIIAIAAIIILDQFGQNISSILTILGAGSLAIGLAAQDTISNMISGFVIMIDRPFRVGDRIRIPTGEVGDVFEIGLRSTKILDFDNNLIIVPNNDLVKTRIVNYGYPHGEIRVIVEVSVAYGVDVDTVKKIMSNTALSHPDVLKEPAPEVFFMKMADWSLDFRLTCRVPSFTIQFKTSEALRVMIYNELNKAGIEIPFPQQVIHHKNDGRDALLPSSKRKKISR